MYILKNALKSITRNKGRNILIGIIALVIALSSCVALSIRQAAQTARDDTLATLSVTATISYDRSKLMEQAKEQFMKDSSGGNTDSGSFKRFDFSSLQGDALSLDDYIKYAAAQSDGDSYYYTNSASLNASGDLTPYSTDSTDSDEQASTTATSASDSSSSDSQIPQQGGMPDLSGMGGGGMQFTARGDFSITGYSSYEAMLSLFGDDGSCTVSDGSMFDIESDDLQCVISDELAMLNDLAVGDTIILENPNCEDETYTLTISGIYTNSASDEGNSRFAQSDPANNIYMSYSAVKAITDASEKAGNTYTDNNDEQKSAALTNEIGFTYVFSDSDHYYSFSEKVYDLGLSEDYLVSSPDISSFESSLTPLETLSTMAGWFFIVVLVVGGIVLVVLNVFNLRERKYEVGVLTAIGMKKRKVATQFVCELLIVTFVAILIGAAAGAATSVPVTNALLKNQVSSAQSTNESLDKNFGFMPQDGENAPSGGFSFSKGGNGMGAIGMGGNAVNGKTVSYIESVSTATDLTVILQLIAVGLFLTLISSLAAVVTIMRYEPLKILSGRA